jgi:hypothetical protein
MIRGGWPVYKKPMQGLVRHKPVWARVWSKCAPIARYNLQRALPEVWRLHWSLDVAEALRAALLQRLGGNERATALLMDALMQNDWLHLTGGALLAVLQGEPIAPAQDLDCFVTGRWENFVQPWCDAHHCELSPLVSEEYRNTQYQVSTYGALQFIYCTCHAGMGRHLRSFDMAFCANVFSRGRLYMANPDQVTLRRTCVSPAQYARARLSGGISRRTTMHDAVQYIWQRRVLKYRQRGYRIDVDPVGTPDQVARCIQFERGYIAPDKARQLMGYGLATHGVNEQVTQAYYEQALTRQDEPIRWKLAVEWVRAWNQLLSIATNTI